MLAFGLHLALQKLGLAQFVRVFDCGIPLRLYEFWGFSLLLEVVLDWRLLDRLSSWLQTC